MMIAKKYTVPDTCPENCEFRESFLHPGQDDFCIRCPVFVCNREVASVDPDNYRPDWAEEWEKFFKGESEYPTLYIIS